MFDILNIPAADPVELPLAGGPGPLFATLASYLLFLVVGPKLMANREPFKLQGVLKVYNILQILFNSAILIGFIWNMTKEKLYDFQCLTVLPIDHSMKSLDRAVCYAYYINKVLDLTDTIFFVLRKSYKQITALHLIHHIYMVLANYFLIRLYGYGGHFIVILFLNTIVHVLMYGYYYVSSQRPGLKQNRWFKKYVTIVQLIQFVLCFAHSAWTYAQPDCAVPRWNIYLVLFMTSWMFVMFTKFYMHAYVLPKKKSV